MVKKILVYWRDIPAQVIVQRGRRREKVQLSRRFQEAIDRAAIARHGLTIDAVQDVIQTAVGGRVVSTSIEGRERYPVRVRYQRELRDSIVTDDEAEFLTAAVLGLVGLLAGYFPARDASRLDPVIAMKL